MSWAEIKKFLNKRSDKALNEIVEGHYDKLHKVNRVLLGNTVTCANGSTTTVVNITGKGRLYGVLTSIFTQLPDSQITTIVIDGETKTFAVKGAPSSNGAKEFALASLDKFSVDGDGLLAIGPFKAVHSQNITCGLDKIEICPFASTTFTSTGNSGRLMCIVDDYIEFNESLEITFKPVGAAGYGLVLYSLEE